eukprot:g61906.t1
MLRNDSDSSLQCAVGITWNYLHKKIVRNIELSTGARIFTIGDCVIWASIDLSCSIMTHGQIQFIVYNGAAAVSFTTIQQTFLPNVRYCYSEKVE